MLTGCSLLTMEDMEKAAEIGFDYVEFMGKYLVSLTEEEFSLLLKKQEALSLRALGINGYCPPEIRMADPGFDREKIKSYAAHCAKRARALGVKFAGIGSPMSRNLPEGALVSEAQRQLKEFLSITCEEFAAADITVCLEALGSCYCNFINYLEEAYAVTEELNLPNLAVVADFYNMEHMGEADRDVKGFGKRILHAHISDDDGSPRQRSYLKPEKASLHQSRIKGLLDIGYQGGITLEIDCPIQSKRAEQSLRIMKGADAAPGF